MADSNRFHLPEGLRYTCRMDGLCCRDSWEIQVEPGAEERIEEIDWHPCSRLPGKADSPFERSKSSTGALLLKRVGEGCHFLNDKNLCGLHAAHGFEIKPHACRLFPYRFIDTPDGVSVGVSFGCDSVLHDEGQPVAEQLDDIRWLYEHEPEHRRIDEPVRLDLATPMSWEQYTRVEWALDAILGNEARPFAECLVAGHVWLSMLAQMMQVARSNPQAIGGATPETMTPEQVLDYYVVKTAEDGFARAFQIAERRGVNTTLKRVVLGTVLALRNTVSPGTGRLGAALRLSAGYLRHWARIGSLRMEPLKHKIRYRAFRPIPEILEREDMQALLRKYFRHALFRKDPIAGTDLFWGYSYFVLMVGMIEYYATALAMAGERDLTMALCYVEKYYVLHSGFGRSVLYHPAIADTFQRVFTRPNFAHAIVYS